MPKYYDAIVMLAGKEKGWRSVLNNAHSVKYDVIPR
ncbi:hypothetical protein SAMN05443545_107151 [Aidingimonas halophila]|uniref:Uncharacterized protein n=1 Tax=Aidingimonas halophila TaxID=574349 RepID=A0A1H3EJJ2_9GAMM|nr:hypothetical protein SAMN05443545_107151 [Aidingimonas halophila]